MAMLFTVTSFPSVAPTVTTDAVSNITKTTAVCGGNVTSEGSASVTDKGICYNTTGTPTISDTVISGGSGSGSFSCSMTGLSVGKKYYVRAYATSSVGTSYGSEVEFTTVAYVRTNKILRRVLQNLKDVSQKNYKIDMLLDRLNLIQEELCRDYFALKGTATLSIISGTSTYTIDSSIFKIFRIYAPTPPSDWKDKNGIEIVTDPHMWNHIKQGIIKGNKTFGYLWNGSLELFPVPKVTVDMLMDVYLLPTTDILYTTDPEISAQWDVPMEYGVTAIYDPQYIPLYESKATTQMNQNLKEAIQGTQYVDYPERAIWEGSYGND